MPLGHLGGAHIFRGEFPRFSKSLWWTFPLAPPSPPCPPLAQGPTAGRFQGPRHLQRGVQGATRPICGLGPLGALTRLSLAPLPPPGPPLAPPAPPWAPLAPLHRPAP